MIQTIKNITSNFSKNFFFYMFLITAFLFYDYHTQVSGVEKPTLAAKNSILYKGYDKVVGVSSWAVNCVTDGVNYLTTPKPVGIFDGEIVDETYNLEPVPDPPSAIIDSGKTYYQIMDN